MDDQNNTTNNQPQVQAPTSSQGVTLSTDQQAQPVLSPAQPVSLAQKELGGIIPQAEIRTDEFIKPSEKGPEIPIEAAEAGVEEIKEEPVLSEDHKNSGLAHAKESVPIQTAPAGTIVLPMSEEEAEKVVKFHKKVSDSVLWLAVLVLKQIKMMHQKISNANG